MYFQEPSLLQFQQELQDKRHQNNLCTLFGIKTISGNNAMKDTLDAQDSALFTPIFNTDGSKKQDCETNAAKRYLPKLRKMFPKKKLIITGDDLFSRQPAIEIVLNNQFHFFFVAFIGETSIGLIACPVCKQKI